MFSRSKKGVGIHISENEKGEKFSGDGYIVYGNCIVNNNTVETPCGTTSRNRPPPFNINEENTNSKRYNRLRNADFVLPRFKTVTYGRHSLRFLGPQLWSKLSKEERNIGTLATFRTMIREKDLISFLEGCGSECRLCLGKLGVRIFTYSF